MAKGQYIAIGIYIGVLMSSMAMLLFAATHPSSVSDNLFAISSEVFKATASALCGAASVLMGVRHAER
jgi:hypothetical protein